MREIVFEVRDDPECGLRARALGYSIFTQAEDMEEMKSMVRDAVQLFFEGEEDKPGLIRLLCMHEDTIAA